MSKIRVCLGCSMNKTACINDKIDTCDDEDKIIHLITVDPEAFVVPQEFEFGQMVEFKKIHGDWSKGLYCGVNERGNRIVRSNENDSVFASQDIRLPVRDRLKRGQPLIINGGILRFFSSIIDDYMYAFSDNLHGREKINSWRLPTSKELEEIGHDKFCWITEG